MSPRSLTLSALAGIGEIEPGANLPGMVARALRACGAVVPVGSVQVVAQAILSKAEGRLLALDELQPSARAVRRR